MKKFEGILFCTDLDGTLLSDDSTISKENLDAIEYFKSEGGLFTFITGRMPYYVSDIYDKINPNAPFGCINGGGIYDPQRGEYVWTMELPRSAIELVEYVDKNIEGISIQVDTFERIYFCRDNLAAEIFRQVTGVPNIVKDYNCVTEPIAKVIFGDVDNNKLLRLADLLSSHPRASEFDFIRSAKILYEILPKGTNKGNVLPKLADHLGIDMARTIAIGDYNNDVNMLRTAGCGIAVANAVDEAKAAADRITVSNNDSAIAKVISELDEGILKI